MRQGRTWTLALLSLAAILLLWDLSATDLWAPDEPRYAQVAEEMRALERGPADLVLLRLNGDPYTQKPPLYYWLAALAGAPGGRVTEWGARLPSALAGIAAVWVTLQLAQALFRSRAVGLWSAAILLTTFRFAHLARRAQLDVLLTLFEVTALLAFWRLETVSGNGRSGERPHTATLVLLHGALGCAVLTKGPVGLLPLAVMAGYLAWEGRLSRMREIVPAWSFLLSLAPALLWLAGSVVLAPDGFFQDAVVDNLVSRFFAGTSHARPFYYYLYQFPADFLPWTALWPLAVLCALRPLRGRDPQLGNASDETTVSAWRFIVVWVVLTVVFFSLSAGKRGLYLLPAFPGVAIACGAALTVALTRTNEAPRWLGTLSVAMAVSLLAAGAVLALLFGAGLEFEGLPGFPIPRSFGVALVATAVACATALAWRRPWRLPSPGRIAAAGFICAYGVELGVFSLLYPAFDPQKSLRPIAMALASATEPGDTVAVFQHRSMIGALNYYGARDVEALESLEEVRDFMRKGGAAIAARAKHQDALLATAALEVTDSFRHGRRRVVILARRIGRKRGASTSTVVEPRDFARGSP